MSVFGPNQRQELLIGNAAAAQTSFATFQSGASNKELGVVGAKGGNPASNEKFLILQKTDGNSSKGLDYEFSEIIDPNYVTKVVLKAYAPEQTKTILVDGFTGTPIENATYQVRIRLYEDGGSLSPENFRHITGSYVTTSATVTNAEIVNGIVDTLNASLQLEGTGLFNVTNVGDTSITIESVAQIASNPAKNIADPIKFDVEATVKSNGVNAETSLPEIYSILTIDTLTPYNPGVGTGTQVKNLEWFCRGYNYEAYRQTGYPADFDQPALYSSATGAYNVIHIMHYRKTSVVGVEEQPRITTVAVELDVNSGSAIYDDTNAILASLRTVMGDKVPADLGTLAP